MTRYACLEHWEERYKKDPEPFDWFNKYPALKPFLLSAGLEEGHDILMLGCGTSRFDLCYICIRPCSYVYGYVY
ncbi:hypothetical protein EBH_0038540 [Eimeria brunetti]|uniref:Uncharacterized protein n=1 Tax=Eimeria brunetti TaxID=51314 RepID=U6LP43_9EIME|nr:hypothetical protein EBH_0038540 [Eimeria brunetti]